MQQLTIVRPDNRVIIDGVAMPVDLSPLPADNWIISWDNATSRGQIEFDNRSAPPGQGKPNDYITSIADYQWVIDAWSTAKQAFDELTAQRKREADEQARIASENTAKRPSVESLQASIDALTARIAALEAR